MNQSNVLSVSQYSSYVHALPVMSVMERKISGPILEPMSFYVTVWNMDKIKYYCHLGGEIEE